MKWLDADIICLQEVDPFYFPHLVKELSVLGYQGIFKRHREDLGSDGLATFYKSKVFKMKESRTYGFNELFGKISDLSQYKTSNRHNQRSAQYTMLQEAESGKQIAVGLLASLVFHIVDVY